MGLNFLLGPVSYLFPAQPSQRMGASTGGLVPSVSRAHTSVILALTECPTRQPRFTRLASGRCANNRVSRLSRLPHGDAYAWGLSVSLHDRNNLTLWPT